MGMPEKLDGVVAVTFTVAFPFLVRGHEVRGYFSFLLS